MPEVILILVIALIVFGPRKLPELGKSLGQAMSQFRRASEDFKRTWEQEVDLEKSKTGSGQTALGSANPEASGYSSDYYSYGYEPEYGGADSTATGSDSTVTTPATATAAQPGSSGAAEVKAEEVKTGTTNEKPHWI
ncbi:MAG: twin-arginine translocase TatA/TatE family subunit [Blastocatellia bacterium]